MEKITEEEETSDLELDNLDTGLENGNLMDKVDPMNGNVVFLIH